MPRLPAESSRAVHRSGSLPALILAAAAALAAEEPSAGAKPDRHGAPLPPAEAPGRMTLPPGFHIALAAAEPDVRQPIAFTIDDRGRLWVVECYSYPDWKPTGRDRVLILDDEDGDGRLERIQVFWDQGANLSGIELGHGGVWLCATPNFLFLPDRDGDDRPDGPPVTVLDGWDLKAEHNVFSTLKWGPDGWLYGCNGILSNSRVGKPGTPAAARVPIDCGVWRYHPVKERFEAVAWGTTNPWGLDFDDHGEMFITNCVIPHLFHVVPGAHFQRMYGQDLNPNLHALMESCADHLHWAGGAWQGSRDGQGKHGEAGGGHAHVGAMIYLGDGWPAEYRGALFTCNIHGKRVNQDRLRRQGSGYVATHGKDFLLANHSWFRGLELKYGPDGSVFLTDWSDAGECHENDDHGSHRESGRIYRISHGEPARAARPDLARRSDRELADLQLHPNDWFVRHARRLLAQRAAAGKDLGEARAVLAAMLRDQSEVPRRLRALWALHAAGGADGDLLLKLLDDPSEHLRAWAVRLLVDDRDPPRAAIDRFVSLAREDPSPFTRLYLASALQRLPVAERWPIAAGLAGHAEDAHDANLPLMIWYGIESACGSEPERAAELAAAARIPLVAELAARRAATAKEGPGGGAGPGLARLIELLGAPSDRDPELLAGILAALRGRKDLAPPPGWPAAASRLTRSPRLEIRESALLLGLLLGDAEARARLEERLGDPQAPAAERERALQALVERGVPGLAPRLHALLDDRALRGPTLRALAAREDPAAPRAILDRYPTFSAREREDALATLAARSAYALALLEAMEKGAVPRKDLSAYAARQIAALGAPVRERLEQVWGAVRAPAADKADLVRRRKSSLAPERLREADLGRGKAVFQRSCGACHQLHGEGSAIGPDLTGSDRANLDYLLENLIDPSATIPRDYKLVTAVAADGRVVSGIVKERSEKTLALQTANEVVYLAAADLAEVAPSETSMMPEGLLDQLSPEEVRDLIAYLAAPGPPAGASGGGR